MYLTRELTGATLAEIGHEFGGMQHSTVLHSVRKIEAMCRMVKILVLPADPRTNLTSSPAS